MHITHKPGFLKFPHAVNDVQTNSSMEGEYIIYEHFAMKENIVSSYLTFVISLSLL